MFAKADMRKRNSHNQAVPQKKPIDGEYRVGNRAAVGVKPESNYHCGTCPACQGCHRITLPKSTNQRNRLR
jgi:hypothetical protein